MTNRLEAPKSNELPQPFSVVHVEDEEMYREEIRDALEILFGQNLTLQTVTTKEEWNTWRENFKKSPVAPDLLILDGRLERGDDKDISGHIVGREVQTIFPDTPTIIYSSAPKKVIQPEEWFTPISFKAAIDKFDISAPHELAEIIRQALENK